MPELTDAELATAMTEIAAAYPEYFTTTDEQVAQMADDLCGETVVYPDQP